MATKRKPDITSSMSTQESVIEDDQYFRVIINERGVNDISLDLFYKPHTITLLITCIIGLLYFAFTRDDTHQDLNVWNGLCCLTFFFSILSLLAFPNGPFTRPHPALWRIVFGLSVLYFMMLLFILFQSHGDVRHILVWLSPDLHGSGPDEKDYATNCSDISVQRLYSSFDVFVLCHFFGWFTKALIIRHYGICWTISVLWEITEVAFAHLLPNFAECWWDAIIMDILLCNGLGIWVGMWLCRKLEIRDYHWESIKDIHSATGKLRRAVLQFTPVSWQSVRWLDPHSTIMRIIAVWILIVAWITVELNTFFLKHIFWVPPGHKLNLIRLLLICSMSAPTIRQYYMYVTDTRCKRIGTQCWVFCAIMLTESIICLKFGAKMFRETVAMNMVIWLFVQFIASLVCIYICTVFAERWNKWKHYIDYESPAHQLHRGNTEPHPSVDQCGDTLDSGKPAGDGHMEDKMEDKTDNLMTGTHMSQINGEGQDGKLVSNGYKLRSRSSLHQGVKSAPGSAKVTTEVKSSLS